nr:hypothetical protein [Tanacetum cinerariifolium]
VLEKKATLDAGKNGAAVVKKKYSSSDFDSDNSSYEEEEAKLAPKKPAPVAAKNGKKMTVPLKTVPMMIENSEEEAKATTTKKPAGVAAPKSYLSGLNLYLTPNSKNFYQSMDNGPRPQVLPSGLAHLLTTNGYQGTPLSSLVIEVASERVGLKHVKGALKEAKEKVEKQVEDLTWHLQLEKCLELNAYLPSDVEYSDSHG